MANDKEIVEKRQGKMSATGDILSGKGGRKVFSGVWVIIMANVWFGCHVFVERGLSEKGYLILTILSILLIGFGTIMDTFVAELGHKLVDVVGGFVNARFGIVANKIDKVEVKTDAQPPAA